MVSQKVADDVRPEDYAGSCVVCVRGTDTGITVTGELEWHAAFLVLVGVPRHEATAMMENSTHELDTQGRGQVTYRVCGGCINAANESRAQQMPSPALIAAGIPMPAVTQPEVWN